jgi:hypothetical protein
LGDLPPTQVRTIPTTATGESFQYNVSNRKIRDKTIGLEDEELCCSRSGNILQYPSKFAFARNPKINEKCEWYKASICPGNFVIWIEIPTQQVNYSTAKK